MCLKTHTVGTTWCYYVTINAFSSCRARPATPDRARADCFVQYRTAAHRHRRCAVHQSLPLQCYFTPGTQQSNTQEKQAAVA